MNDKIRQLISEYYEIASEYPLTVDDYIKFRKLAAEEGFGIATKMPPVVRETREQPQSVTSEPLPESAPMQKQSFQVVQEQEPKKRTFQPKKQTGKSALEMMRAFDS